ncbi:GNAT family N-acetyltransferase [Aurantibacter sp.]|uniref:GNAT family N-acetyltransferase n=1 Tax=Aurantibacter sp. TaxID=2807103 RepID=UPI0035C7CB1E
MFEVLKIEDEKQWRFLVDQCQEFDFYHTWDYHRLSKENKEGEPELIVYKEEEALILLPLLKREIQNPKGATFNYDYTSAYGYVGPIFKGEISEKIIENFKLVFKEHCISNNIISVFSRLHPTISQGFVLKHIGEIDYNSVTIQIDLTQTLEEQKKHYRKSNKSEINKLRRNSEIIWSDHSEKDINEFVEIYEETMKRVNAHKRYFFDKTYYHNLFTSKDYKTQLVFVEMDGIRIAGALFVFCKNIIQYHLAGTRTEFMKITPMKLLLDEIRLYGNEKEYNTFHLGGGLCSSPEDPLYRFKRGFSKIECEFNTFRYIVDSDKYKQLSKELISDQEKLKSEFFPLYRA